MLSVSLAASAIFSRAKPFTLFAKSKFTSHPSTFVYAAQFIINSGFTSFALAKTASLSQISNV